MARTSKQFQAVGLGGLVTAGIAFAVSLVLAGGLGWAKLSRSMELEKLDDAILAHQTLTPIVARLHERQSEMEMLLKPSTVYKMPENVIGLLRTLRTVAADAGLNNTQFVPEAISVVGQNDIRLTGEARGATDAFRRFIVGLSSQEWVASIGRVKAVAGEDADSNAYEVTVRARFKLLDNPRGGEQ